MIVNTSDFIYYVDSRIQVSVILQYPQINIHVY